MGEQNKFQIRIKLLFIVVYTTTESEPFQT